MRYSAAHVDSLPVNRLIAALIDKYLPQQKRPPPDKTESTPASGEPLLIPQSQADCEKVRPAALKKWLNGQGISTAGIIERHELVDLARSMFLAPTRARADEQPQPQLQSSSPQQQNAVAAPASVATLSAQGSGRSAIVLDAVVDDCDDETPRAVGTADEDFDPNFDALSGEIRVANSTVGGAAEETPPHDIAAQSSQSTPAGASSGAPEVLGASDRVSAPYAQTSAAEHDEDDSTQLSTLQLPPELDSERPAVQFCHHEFRAQMGLRG